jgi:hypothetical protein
MHGGQNKIQKKREKKSLEIENFIHRRKKGSSHIRKLSTTKISEISGTKVTLVGASSLKYSVPHFAAPNLMFDDFT